jgi:hypothetical protein
MVLVACLGPSLDVQEEKIWNTSTCIEFKKIGVSYQSQGIHGANKISKNESNLEFGETVNGTRR